MTGSWSTYKSVSHLWAAAALWNELPSGNRSEQPSGNLIFLLDHEACLLFLAIAEAFRKAGEIIIPERQMKPILAGTDLWVVPEDSVLPDIDLPSLPLQPWVDDILAGYRPQR